MTSTQFNPSAVLQQMLGGATATSLLYIAAELGLCDLLAGGPLSSAELVKRTGAHADALTRVLRGLATIGVLDTTDEGRTYSLAPLGNALRSDVAGSVLVAARLMAHPIASRAWGGLLHTVKTGEPAFDHAVGADFATYMLGDAEFGQAFNAFMSGVTAEVVPAVISAYDFTGIQTLIDVGGGIGTLLRAILRSYSGASGLVFDLPHAEAQTEQAIAQDNLGGRCRFVGGDFFERVPSGADAYLLKSVLHDWDDDSCVAILTSIRAAMRPDSRILIVERPLSMAPDVVMSDLTMLAMTPGGRERSADEYHALCARAGLTIERVVPTSAQVCVYEVRRD